MRKRWMIRCWRPLIRAQAYADGAVRHFDIQSQAAASAVNEFARQADITLVFSSAWWPGIKPRSHGDFTVIDGLKRLLDGTGLSFNQVNASTIAISAGAMRQVLTNRRPTTQGRQ